MVFIPKFQISNETSPVNKILTISNNSNDETNSTLSDDLIESQQNDEVGNSSLRSADNEDNWENVGVILNMLLKSPQDLEQQGKSSGVELAKINSLL